MTEARMTGTPSPSLSRRLTGLLRRVVYGRVPKLFDTAYYLSRHPDAAASALDPYLHYALIGGRRDYDPNADFDTAFYRSQGRAGSNPLRHYIKVGTGQGLDPHPRFSTFRYLGRYPDVADDKANPLLHYREHGRPERRIADHSTHLPRTLVALSGIPSAHRWSLPGGGQRRFEITLLRTPPVEPRGESIESLRLSICLDFDVVDHLIGLIARFPTGSQDVMQFVLPAEPSRGGKIPSLIMAFEHCFFDSIAGEKIRIIHYGEAVLWDIRPITPHVVAVLPDGAIQFETA